MPYANYWPGVLDNLRTIIKAAWPEVTGIFEVLTAERYNWASLLERKQLTAPYAIIQIPEVGSPSDYGMDNLAMTGHWVVWYVARTGGTQVADVRAKLKTLLNNLISSSSPLSHCQVMEDFAFHASEMSPIAASMLRHQAPLHGGGLGFTLIFGETAGL